MLRAFAPVTLDQGCWRAPMRTRSRQTHTIARLTRGN